MGKEYRTVAWLLKERDVFLFSPAGSRTSMHSKRVAKGTVV